MGRIIKKFNQYIKEDLDALGKQPSRQPVDYNDDFEDSDEFFPGGNDGEGPEDPSELIDDEYSGSIKSYYIDDEDLDDFSDQEEEVEESGYEGGRMLLELARKLGSKVINNEINYNGQIITCFSEDDKFRIGNQIIGKNVEEAYRNIQVGKFQDEDNFGDDGFGDGLQEGIVDKLDKWTQKPLRKQHAQAFPNGPFGKSNSTSKKVNCNCCENCSGVMGKCGCKCKNCKCSKNLTTKR